MIVHQTSNSVGNYYRNLYIYDRVYFDMHFHANYELVYVTDGTLELTVNGESIPMSKGELIIIPPYSVHSLLSTEGRTWVSVFSEDHIVSFTQNQIRYSKFRCDPNIEKILNELFFTETLPDHYVYISCLYMLLNECIKNASPIYDDAKHSFVRNVVSLISQNLTNYVTLKDLANSLNYEYHYFSSLFQRHFCMNFRSFINLIKYEKACELLNKGNTSTATIAQNCGFGSIRNFNRVFKQLSGVTPSEYKNQINH